MRALVVVLTASCVAKSTPEPVRNRAAAPPKPACTEELVESIKKDLQPRWNSETPLAVRCTPGLFPTPGFYVEVDNNDVFHAAILGVDGKTEVVPFKSDGHRLRATSIIDCATVDLDGDGVDEIVETWRAKHGLIGSESWLQVRRVDNRAFADLRGPYTSVYHPELGGCVAEVRLAGQTIVITVEAGVGIPPSDCLAAGTHTFALDGNSIIEVSRLTKR